jgi:hypothetical protein
MTLFPDDVLAVVLLPLLAALSNVKGKLRGDLARAMPCMDRDRSNRQLHPLVGQSPLPWYGNIHEWKVLIFEGTQIAASTPEKTFSGGRNWSLTATNVMRAP